MRRRGQAALEFLVTYGWALLAIVVVLGLVGYFTGFFSHWMPAQCVAGLPFMCSEFKVSQDGTVQMGIYNSGSEDVSVKSLTLVCNSDPAQSRTVVLNDFVRSQERINKTLVGIVCPQMDPSRFRADLSIDYVASGASQGHTALGYMRAKVEEN